MRAASSKHAARWFAMCAAACLAAACGSESGPATSQAPHDEASQALLDEAIKAAGGEAALSRVHALRWYGEATVHDGDRQLALGVETRVEPFLRATSETWMLDDKRATTRTLEIGPDAGWMVKGRERTPMPAPMLAHERLQYATYGLMLLVPLRAKDVVLRRDPDVDGLRVLHVEHPRAAPSDLFFDKQGRLVRIDNVVPKPDGIGSDRQRFDFEGQIEANGLVWPRGMRISHDGQPYFELRLATLSVE